MTCRIRREPADPGGSGDGTYLSFMEVLSDCYD